MFSKKNRYFVGIVLGAIFSFQALEAGQFDVCTESFWKKATKVDIAGIKNPNCFCSVAGLCFVEKAGFCQYFRCVRLEISAVS